MAKKLSREELIIFKDRIMRFCKKHPDYTVSMVSKSVECGEYNTRILINELVLEGLIEKSKRSKVLEKNGKNTIRQSMKLKIFDCNQLCILIEEFFRDLKDFEELQSYSPEMLLTVYREIINLFSNGIGSDFRRYNLKSIEDIYEELFFRSIDKKLNEEF